MRRLPLSIITAALLLAGCAGERGPQGPVGSAYAVSPLLDSTITPKLIWSWPTDGLVGPLCGFNRQISLRFNKIVNVKSVIAAVQLSPLTPGYCQFTYTAINQLEEPSEAFGMRLRTESGLYWEIGQTYTVTLPPTWVDMNGNHPDSAQSFSFMPEPYFRVFADISALALVDTTNTEFLLIFNSPPDSLLLLSAMSISPVVPLGIQQIEAGNAFVAMLLPVLPANTVYTVSVDTTVHDTLGRPLHGPYQFTFKTKP